MALAESRACRGLMTAMAKPDDAASTTSGDSNPPVASTTINRTCADCKYAQVIDW